MFQFFSPSQKHSSEKGGDFSYLPKEMYYFDSSCQSLRPRQVIDAEKEYYEEYNACGGRVKYAWGQRVDERVAETRVLLRELVGKDKASYEVAFTLNTTYGINMLLQQLPPEGFEGIITSDIEHNSVFLPTISWATQHNKKRIVLSRNLDGSLPLESIPEGKWILLVNTVSNIDGRELLNVKEVTYHIQKQGGIVIFDGAQTFAHHPELLHEVPFDAVCGSGHKMYGPSMGFIIYKKALLSHLKFSFIGGGTVDDVEEEKYILSKNPEETFALLEPGLQNWAAICGLHAALIWRKEQNFSKMSSLMELLYEGLKVLPRVHVVNQKATSTVSFYVEGIDSHQIALYLSERNIMCRSGYFCCHYFLKHKSKLPPLVRCSLGIHSSREDVNYFLSSLHLIINAL